MRLSGFLFMLFVAVPIAEIALFVVVGGRIGLGWTLAIVVATALIGSALVSRQGRGTWDRIRRELMSGRFPGAELADAAMILVAGALLLTPGFLTDAIGFALLVPPVRAWVRRLVVSRWGGSFTTVTDVEVVEIRDVTPPDPGAEGELPW